MKLVVKLVMKLGAAVALVPVSVLLWGCSTDTTETPDSPLAPSGTFTSLYNDYFSTCKSCHSPAGPGRTSDTEQTLDFTTRSTAFTTITGGTASGLMGNPAGCNGVPFVGATAATSLILAVLDEPTRAAFDLNGHASCDMDTITDETAKVGSAPSTEFIASLKTWLAGGARND